MLFSLFFQTSRNYIVLRQRYSPTLVNDNYPTSLIFYVLCLGIPRQRRKLVPSGCWHGDAPLNYFLFDCYSFCSFILTMIPLPCKFVSGVIFGRGGVVCIEVWFYQCFNLGFWSYSISRVLSIVLLLLFCRILAQKKVARNYFMVNKPVWKYIICLKSWHQQKKRFNLQVQS